MSRLELIDLQMRIGFYKQQLKQDPKDLATKILYESNKAKLKKEIYRGA